MVGYLQKWKVSIYALIKYFNFVTFTLLQFRGKYYTFYSSAFI